MWCIASSAEKLVEGQHDFSDAAAGTPETAKLLVASRQRLSASRTITIPDNAAPGSVLSIPVKGRAENVKVLTQIAGTDEWVEESVLKQEEQAAANAVFGDEALDVMLQHPFYPDSGAARTVVLGAGLTEVPPGIVLPEDKWVRLETTVGVIDIIVRPDWAPGSDTSELVYCRELDGLAFYRLWPPLPDDPPTGVPFLLGAVCFARDPENSGLFVVYGSSKACVKGPYRDNAYTA
ncbi:hypothetical protein AK812_SmicGene17952 [Symbiodinium microadriaticum]|uniref:Uncharacterized protein n=1 Tax=Symbiodinium microadriaticum TaxID=2951 RepID=A0A1Q9DWE9_SYMMI|nr:hypothetical protein AK812_SmicGene17952 [Symbiodinium microadriaticum]